jgi:hypothetical protein
MKNSIYKQSAFDGGTYIKRLNPLLGLGNWVACGYYGNFIAYGNTPTEAILNVKRELWEWANMDFESWEDEKYI